MSDSSVIKDEIDEVKKDIKRVEKKLRNSREDMKVEVQRELVALRLQALGLRQELRGGQS